MSLRIQIFIFRVIEKKGPTNTRIYIVAVYFRGKRLSKGSGHSIQQAEMDAANNALASSKGIWICIQWFHYYFFVCAV